MDDNAGFTKTLIAKLEQCAKAYAAEKGGIHLEAYSTKRFDDIAEHTIDLYFNSYILRLSYYPHVRATAAHSVLGCGVSLEKHSGNRLFYPLAQIFGYFKQCPASALTIPLILEEASMQECFYALIKEFESIQPLIESLSYNEEQKKELYKAEVEAAAKTIWHSSKDVSDAEMQKSINEFKAEVYTQWLDIKQKKSNEVIEEDELNALVRSWVNDAQDVFEEEKRKLLKLYYEGLFIKALGSAYEAYMVGNYSRALKKLRRVKYKTPYELELIKYMEGQHKSTPHVPHEICKNLTELYKDGIPKNNAKEALLIATAMLLFSIMWLPLFLGIYFIFYFIENSNAEYLLGTLDNAPFAMFPSLLMGGVMIYFLSKPFYKLFFKKNYEKLAALDNATRSPATDKAMRIIIGIILVGSVIFLGLTAHQNVKLTKEGLQDNSSFWSLKGDFYSYEEIDRAIYRDKTPTSYGDWMDVPSYVIHLKNGKVLDFYNFETTKQQFLDSLQKHGVLIE
ncbi:MAG: hypothetical protein LBS74_01640 [Oscillospiraceae bacterium]|jgi:hypothetical protein|nr:hypothetical protein [Oscillospiraceae bacterium]